MTTAASTPPPALRGRELDAAIDQLDAEIERLAVARDETPPGPRYEMACLAHARAVGLFDDLCEQRANSRRRGS
jgi:hypothetical protein